MAATVSWESLRGLAEFRAQKGCAVSLYLDLDPAVTPTAGDAASRLNSLLDEAAKSNGATREELADRYEAQPRRHDQGGWSQARYQRRVDVLAADHMRDVATEVDRQLRRF